MIDRITTAQRVFSNRCIGISKRLIELDRIHDKNRMVSVIIDDSEYSLRHADDNTNRLSGITEVEQLFKKVKQFSYYYDSKKNAVVIELSKRNVQAEEESSEHYRKFPDDLREKGEKMAQYYIIIFCLENFIRNLISNTLESVHGQNWWDKCVDEKIKDVVSATIKREKDAGVTLRSTQEIDYTTFGQLSDIINSNWQDFESTFESKNAFTRIMHTFNTLRGPIAHCCDLAEDEKKRLEVNMNDWFKRCLKR